MKKFENFVIVTDLDGTFFGRRIKAVPRNIEKIKYFTENGGHFTAATGRAVVHALDRCPILAELINLPFVACNGAVAYDVKEDKLVESYTIPYEDVRNVLEIVHSRFETAGARASDLDGFVATEYDFRNSFIKTDIESFSSGRVMEMDKWENLDIHKFAIRDDAEKISEIKEILTRELGDRLGITQSWSTIIDIEPKNCTKATTVKKVVNDYVGKDAVIFACGDFDNDIEMLKMANFAVCPSNAVDSVKKISDMCLCDCDEGLIGALIEEIDKGVFI